MTAAGAAAGAQPPAEAQPPREDQPSLAAAPPPPEAQPSLAEAARENRARIAASRERHGPAPRFTDADLAGGRSASAGQPAPPLESEPLLDPPVTSEELPAGDPAEDTAGPSADTVDPDEDTVDPDADDVQAAIGARLRVMAEREAEIQERLLDIEASLAAIGASGLPAAPRHPNRFRSALDTSRLRAEAYALREELDALAVERRLLGAAPAAAVENGRIPGRERLQ